MGADFLRQKALRYEQLAFFGLQREVGDDALLELAPIGATQWC